MRLRWGAAFIVASLWFSCRRGVVAPPPPRAVNPSVAPLPPNVLRGVSYAHDWSGRGVAGYGTESDRAQLRAVRAAGATWVSVMPFGYLRDARETHVRTSYDREGSESDAALRRSIGYARGLGLRVLLKPHLWIPGTWPGALRPRDAASCEALVGSWSELTMHYAALAQETGAEAFTLAVEMDEVARGCPTAWRALIARVRTVFFGTLTWAANWGEPEAVPFWDALDVIGVDHYAPLSTTRGAAGAERAAVIARAREALGRYVALGRRWHKPVWLTEVGFRQDDLSLVEPWSWPEERHAESQVDLQSIGYEATFAAIAQTPGIEAVFLWKWFTSGGTEDEGPSGFVFNGRPAESVVRGAFRTR